MIWVLSLLLGIVVILAITAVTGYFVAQEFAYMAVDRSRLAARAESGDEGAQRALKVTRRTSFMLSGAQLGITVTGLLVGYVAEPLVGQALGEALGGVGVPTGVGIAVGTVLALLLSTIIQMLFGELFPKNLAIAKPEPVALWLARSTNLYLAAFGWLITVFDAASNALLRVLRIEPVHDVEHSATARDLEHIVADSRASGDLPADLSVLLDRILDFPRQDVEHAMIPRARVGAVRADRTVAEIRALMATGHSRYPVLDEEDDVVGVVHLVDLLTGTVPDDATAAELQRPALVLPTAMALPDALRELSASRNAMACVVDEYGSFTGVLTLEDVAEEIVGEITDEHDAPETPALTPQEDGTWTMAGDVHIDEVERAIDHDLPRGDYETVAGLAIEVHGSLPGVGTAVVVDLPPDPANLALPEPPPDKQLHVEVLDVERHVPSLVRVTLADRPANDDEETGR
ncbi:hemolysin family protein [Georgenia satyanarayanai]|uniref:hemolysin family protein n=1 Tax=Georgenia satyanarayanai TaxID=860221 RepID=UPI00204240A6|nr:hemolysin family protein [Georgenia satyanarayanai]MCM3661375.1 hemolysin family protein [Georgenia satyanarayanai]